MYDPKETDSHLPFAYAVTTVLPIDSVWRIFSDVALWSRISDVYESVEWGGEPWVPGSHLRAKYDTPNHWNSDTALWRVRRAGFFGMRLTAR